MYSDWKVICSKEACVFFGEGFLLCFIFVQVELDEVVYDSWNALALLHLTTDICNMYFLKVESRRKF